MLLSSEKELKFLNSVSFQSSQLLFLISPKKHRGNYRIALLLIKPRGHSTRGHRDITGTRDLGAERRSRGRCSRAETGCVSLITTRPLGCRPDRAYTSENSLPCLAGPGRGTGREDLGLSAQGPMTRKREAARVLPRGGRGMCPWVSLQLRRAQGVLRHSSPSRSGYAPAEGCSCWPPSHPLAVPEWLFPGPGPAGQPQALSAQTLCPVPTSGHFTSAH